MRASLSARATIANASARVTVRATTDRAMRARDRDRPTDRTNDRGIVVGPRRATTDDRAIAAGGGPTTTARIGDLSGTLPCSSRARAREERERGGRRMDARARWVEMRAVWIDRSGAVGRRAGRRTCGRGWDEDRARDAGSGERLTSCFFFIRARRRTRRRRLDVRVDRRR